MPDHRCDKCGERERRRTSTGYPDSSLVSSASPSALGFEDGQASGVNPPFYPHPDRVTDAHRLENLRADKRVRYATLRFKRRSRPFAR